MKSIHLLLLLVLVVLFNASAQANSPFKLKVSTEHWPPNSYMDQNGQVTGLATDKVSKILTMAKIDHQIHLYPWARAYHLAKTEPDWAIFSIMRSADREKDFQWVCPLIKQTPLYFAKLSDRKDIVINTLIDIEQYTIAVSRNEYGHQFLLQHGYKQGKNFQLTADSDIPVKLLVAGHVDLAIGNRETIINILQQHNQPTSAVKFAYPVSNDDDNPLCLAFNLKSPKVIVNKVQKALDQLNQKEQSQ